MLRRLWWVVALLAVNGCTRDLEVPPVPQVLPGAVFGRVVVAVPGQAERQPARGATVALLGSSLAVTANDDGRFAHDGLEQASGKLLFRYVEGTRVRQKLLSLENLGAGPNKQVSTGDVLVAENATVRGRVVREETKDLRSGHRSTVVFVPEGPYLTYSADDGSFELDQLPEGEIELGFFRAGYQARVLPALAVRGGELLTVRDTVLSVETNTDPGRITGTVRFVPSVADATGTTAVALGDGFTRPGSVDSAGALDVTMLPAGLYSVAASRTGYTSATAHNLLVTPGATTSVSLTLGTGPGFDAGMPPPPPDAGGAGDAGSTDAGSTDAGAGGCSSTPQCGVGRWCDQGFCVPLCTAGSCTGGRFCDPVTFTCLTPCSAGCDAGTLCDPGINACRSVCDHSRPCPAGNLCNLATSTCEPECGPLRACPAFTTCNGGACTPTGTCALDSDCPTDRMCIGGLCALRPTAALPGGAFPCARACDCRFDETCRWDAGVCVAAPAPTLYFFPGADGGGRYPSTPSGDLLGLTARARRPDVIALLWDAGANLSRTLTLDGGVTLSGGYVDCGPTRWTRDDARRTPLATTADTLVREVATATQPREDVTLKNLEVESHPGMAPLTTLQFEGTARARLENIGARLTGFGGSTASFTTFACTDCDDLTVDGLELLPSADPQSQYDLAQLLRSNGVLGGVTVADSAVLQPFRVLFSRDNSGPLTVASANVGQVNTSVADGLLRFDGCGSFPVTVTSSRLRWTSYGDNRHRLIRFAGCEAVTVSNNVVDGAAQLVQLPTDSQIGAQFLWLESSNALVERNLVVFPSAQGLGGAVAIDVRGPQATVQLRHNVIDGGTNLTYALPLRVTNVSSGGVDVHHNVFDVRGSTTVGLTLENVLGSGNLNVHDNVVRVWAPTTGDGRALTVKDAVAIVERNQLEVRQAGVTHGVHTSGTNVLQLTQNLVVVGPAFASPGGTNGVTLTGTGSYWLVGNTFDLRSDIAQPSPVVGLSCQLGQTRQIHSNIFATGNLPSRTFIAPDGAGGNACLQATAYSRNHFWHSGAGGVSAANDLVQDVITGDATNVYAAQTSPWVPGSYELQAGSACIDTGAAGPNADGGVSTRDVFGRPRVVGAGPDRGATERQ
ncbi:MAG: carboxypeptidase regulatory-like domain-containing protein [Myxococcaceae bacterium]|nr:carboxypeptidase regulatory-like domain-containing protein [Myxococcaceae bacterium]